MSAQGWRKRQIADKQEERMSIEAMKQALEALEGLIKRTSGQAIYSFMETERRIAIAACVGLRQAIEQAEKQEPVAIYQYQLASGSWIDQTKNSYDYNVRHGQATVRVVYTTPQPQQAEKQEPVPWKGCDLDGMVEAFDRVIEAHFFRKNPFHNPIDADAQMALRILRGFIPYMKQYTTPQPQREWVDLTHKEFAEILCDDRWQGRPELMLLQAQDQLRKKNT